MLLTAQQARIVNTPSEKNLLVTAGPGTGKTYVLIARLLRLVEQEDLNPGQDILVLSFTRGAVREIRRRAASAGHNVAHVRPYTFDSFATWLLATWDAEGSWKGEGYDRRIEMALHLMRRTEDLKEYLNSIRHILVDEVQDLVGIRAEFVKALLEFGGGGFCLLGDPAQGIYNFQVDGPERKEGAARLYRWLRLRFVLSEYTLDKNQRALTSEARSASWAGPCLNSDNPDYERIRAELENTLASLSSVGTAKHATLFLRNNNMPTAILCRTNGHALWISRTLHENGIPHRVQRRASDRVIPAWIGRLLAGLYFRSVGKNVLMGRIAEMFDVAELDPSEAWRALKTLSPGAGESLDIGKVAERIRTGNVPEDLVEVRHAELVVSTIHRAKGLEFDQVIVAEPGKLRYDEEEYPAEEARILYVAMTRPRRELRHMVTPDTPGLYRHPETDRWIRRLKRWQTCDIEVRGDDIHSMDPAGAYLYEDDAPATQEYIWAQVREGDSVTLVLLKSSQGGQPRVFYRILHGPENRPIGITSEEFGAILFRILKLGRSWEVRWPTRIEALRVEGVDTVAGSTASAARCGLGPAGLWLRVRVAGLGHLVFG